MLGDGKLVVCKVIFKLGEGIIFYVFILTILFSLLWGFKPKDEKTFRANSLRLLKNQQYTFLTDYFTHYYPTFQQARNRDESYVKKIILKVPFVESKKKIIKAYLTKVQKTAKQRTKKSQSTQKQEALTGEIYYLKAELEYFEEDLRAAYSSFKRSHSIYRYFYLGMISYRLKNFSLSKKWFVKAVKVLGAKVKSVERQKKNKKTSYLSTRDIETTRFFLSQVRLRLAEIYFAEKKYLASFSQLVKVKTSDPLKQILLYLVYLKTGEGKKANKILPLIQQYKQNPLHRELVNQYLSG